MNGATVAIGAILGTIGGPATYAGHLIAALAQLESELRFVILTDAPDALPPIPPTFSVQHLPLSSAWNQLIWDHWRVPLALRRSGAALYHGTKGTLPLWLPCPAVVTIHDLAFYSLPETFALAQRLHLRTHTPLAARQAKRIIADSEHACGDIRRQFAVPAERMAVIPLAADPAFTAAPQEDDSARLESLGIKKPFLLYLGTIQPRKNVEMLVEAFIAADLGDSVELVVAGRMRPGYCPAFATAPPARVRYLGPVDAATARSLYRRALAFCSPSRYEGFGLSLLEAMQSGCPVIAGRNTAVVETVGEAGLLIPELSVAALKDAFGAVAGQPARLAAMRRLGLERAARFSWRATAAATLDVYRRALGADV